MSYLRDASDRLIQRNAAQGDITNIVRYGHTKAGDKSELALGADNSLLSRTFSLPGGVVFTWRPNAAERTADHPSVRGDLALTTAHDGKQVGGTRTFTPNGEPLKADGTIDPDGVPDNLPGQMDHGWSGQHQRPYEHAGALSIVQMGARPYSPLIGRFLSVDPVDGGSANDYDFAEHDAVNNEDLDGRASHRVFGRSQMNWYERIRCLWLPGQCAVYLSISAWATKTAAAWYPRWERGQNAFRHCIWQAMLVVTMGFWNAYAWASAHEGNSRDRDHYQDLHNNNWGRSVGLGAARYGSWAWGVVLSSCYGLLRAGRLAT